jgi:hypothetical protein
MLWIDARTGIAVPPPDQPAVAPGPTFWSNFPPNGRRIRPNQVNGIKWFLDGRSYFSD